MSGLPALIGGGMVSLLALLLLFFVLVMLLAPLSEAARSAARQLDLAPYVDQLIANGIGLDTIVYFARRGGDARGGRPPVPMGRVSTGRHQGAPGA